jgi:alpha 1,3-glucosidase
MALYGSVPLLISHSEARTTAVLWFNAAETWIDIEKKDGNVLSHWFSESGIIDVFFLFGPTPQDFFRQYAALTGTTSIPPVFSLGYHQCKWNYKDQREVAEVHAGFDQNNIPVDVIWLDIEHTDKKKYFTWDEHHFPNPIEMQKEIREKGRKMVTIIDPHIKRDDSYYIHTTAQSLGLYIKSAKDDGLEDYEGHCWPGSSSWIDYADPKAREWWTNQFTFDNYKGSTDILYTWNDMNEPSVFSGPGSSPKIISLFSHSFRF